MQKSLSKLEIFLEKIDHYRDEFLFLFIKPYWPRKIGPNYVTFIRIIIGVVLFVLLFFFRIEDKILIVSLFIVGVVTDFIDGPIARGTDKVTELGAMLDSTADRILIIPIMFYALLKIHKWLLLILVLVEVINALASIYYKSKEIYLESNIFGKIKMTMLSIVFVAILVMWPKNPSLFFVDILWASLLFSFLSIFTRIIELKNKGHIKNKIINKTLI
jgi:CDP-diacylglycerol---glycerol-3-phosphate 3-phosphatidyltransferase